MTNTPKTSLKFLGRKELIKYIAKEGPAQYLDIGHQEKAGKVLDVVLAGITEALKEGSLRFIGFGTFFVRDKLASKGRNPSTGEPVQIPSHKRLVFKAGKK